MAHRAGDPHLVAYALSCKAMVYADAGDGLGAVDLADAALAVDGDVCVKARIMATEHAALGHAMLGERSAVDRRLDHMAQLIEDIELDEPLWGGDRLRRTPGEIIDVQRATCYERLGVADQAAPLWEQLMRRSATDRRDRGVHLARQASTLVDLGEVDAAMSNTADVLRYLGETGSARMGRELQRLRV